MSKAIHPEISSIINVRNQIREYLRMKHYQPEDALELMALLLEEIRREHRDAELLANIQKERIFYAETTSKVQKANQSRKTKIVYEGFLEKINHILWEHDYLLEGTYRPKTRRDNFFEPT